MGNKLQEIYDKEKIQEERIRFNNYQKEFQKQIREADNERLKEYYKEFAKDELDFKVVQGAFKFLKFMLEK